MKKQILSIVLTLCMLLTVLPLTALAADAETWTNGTQTYTLEDGVLTITGTGEISIDWQYSLDRCSVTSVVICEGITGIDAYAFLECEALTSITIPNSVTTIAPWAFRQCSGLTSITIPNSVTTIGECAFSGCTSLTQINIDDGNTVYTSIDGVVFSKDESKIIIVPGGRNGAYTIPNNVTTIERNAFDGCSGLTSITIPNSVTTIGECAFDGCSGLTSITIPNSVTTIGGCAFSGCTSLTQINIDDGNTVYTSIDGVVFSKDESKIIIVPGGRNGAYTIPNSVTSIEEGAFAGCHVLTNITIPKGVITIGGRAFLQCTGLTSVTIPDGVETIGDYAFYGANFSSIVIPNSVRTIAAYAFDQCRNLTNAYYLGTNEEWNVLLPNIGGKYSLLTSVVKCIVYNESVNLVYDGNKKEVYTSQTDGVTVKYYQGKNEVSPIDAGTYTAKVGNDAIGTFTITKGEQNAPTGLVGTAETIYDKADGTITGVTTEMEYRKEGDTDYTAITGTEITDLADGTYYVRYKANNNQNVSADTPVTIGKGKCGYYTPITFDPNGGTVGTTTATTDANGKLTTIPTPTRKNYSFLGWFTKSGEMITTETIFTEHTTVYAHWQILSSSFLPTWQGWELIDKIVAANKKKDEPVETEPEETEPVETEPTETEPVAEPWNNPFSDVAETDTFYDAIKFVYENGYMNGMSTDTFAPDEGLTRGMLVTVLYRAAGAPVMDEANPFVDVANDAWYYNAVVWAKSIGLINGITETEFAPDDELTREQLVTIFYRYAAFLGYDLSIGEDTNILSYEDFADIAEYAIPAMQWACGARLIDGADGNMLPKDNATRALVAMVLYGFYA